MILEQFEDKFTRYEVARILGARSLQLAMDAPVLLKLTNDEVEELNYDTLLIAEKEFSAEVLPITVKRPLPKKSEKSVRKLTDEEVREKLEKQAEKEAKAIEKIEENKEAKEKEEEKEIQEQGEIMEMAKPDDEGEEEEVKPEVAQDIV
ncbi:DNA-directed RNA polymerase subunit K [archaeon]|jgi:DNA-directed RNA polymerase subunit K|nr:DNA-directed RNA polymerase subunit K [Candidatus Woesearchaeota archaeon]MBT4136116.1 DNA-directed RNA polymerase subunit K [archaeon]MBT4242247.1 DNA-directed RNA polymerase subunit K [archaeon]MBT4417935.1 DNA-directed RNA polymerase subunit K [archaeon]